MNYTPYNLPTKLSSNLSANLPKNQTNMSKVIEIKNNNNIQEFYPRILYFTAKWCGPCQRIQPFYKNLAENYDTIKFFKIDVDENSDLASRYNIKSMPTFIFYKNKDNFNILTGADSEKLIQRVNNLL